MDGFIHVSVDEVSAALLHIETTKKITLHRDTLKSLADTVGLTWYQRRKPAKEFHTIQQSVLLEKASSHGLNSEDERFKAYGAAVSYIFRTRAREAKAARRRRLARDAVPAPKEVCEPAAPIHTFNARGQGEFFFGGL